MKYMKRLLSSCSSVHQVSLIEINFNKADVSIGTAKATVIRQNLCGILKAKLEVTALRTHHEEIIPVMLVIFFYRKYNKLSYYGVNYMCHHFNC